MRLFFLAIKSFLSLLDNTVGVGANDPQGRRQLARYMIRNPFSLKKMEYQAQQGMTRYKMSLTDAYVAALTKIKKAELVSGDPEFKPLEGSLKVIVWLQQ